MARAIRTLDEDTLPRFRELLREHRAASWSDAFLDRYLRWRYLGRQGWTTLLGFAKDRCVAMIDCQLRPYAAGGGEVRIQETSEWFCLPRYRPVGVGVRLIQELMGRDEPILAVRGTEDTKKLLPRLGWRTLSDISNFRAMANWRTTLEAAARRMGRALSGRRLRAVETEPGAGGLDAFRGLDSPRFALRPRVMSWEMDWLLAAPPEIGAFRWLAVHRADEPVGTALVRIYEDQKFRRGQIVEMTAAGDSAEAYADVACAALDFLRDQGAVMVRTRATAQSVCRGLAACGFRVDPPQPVFWWGEPVEGEVNVMFLRGDDHLRPFVAG